MAQTFQRGDIVQLKSGGPEMTVEETFMDNSITCHWFAGKKLESGVFRVETVRPVDGKPKE